MFQKHRVFLTLVLLASLSVVTPFPCVSAQDDRNLGIPVGQGTRELKLDQILGPRAALLFPRGLHGLQWHPDSTKLSWFKRVKGKPVLVTQPLDGGEETVVLTADALATAWKKAKLPGQAPPLSQAMQWNEDGRSLRLFQGGALWRIELNPLQITLRHRLPSGAGAMAFSSGDERVAFVKDHDIHVLASDGVIQPVTRDGNVDVTYGVSVSRNEFGIHDGLWWDPTGRRLAFYKEDLRPIEPYPYVDFKKRPAAAVHGRYPMAGRKGSVVSVGVFDSRTNKVVWLETDPLADDYLTNVTWGPDGRRLYVAHVNRGQDQMALVEYDAVTGKRLRTLFTENDEQWIEPEHGPVFLPDRSGKFLWLSPREGFDQYHLLNREGKVLARVTPGEYDVIAFKGWDGDGQGFFFESTGENPREKHLFHASLEGAVQQVTRGRGQHETLLAPDRCRVIDVHRSLELPLAVDLLTLQGVTVRRLHESPDPLKDYRLGTHRFFTVRSSDDQDLYGHIIFPPDLDPAKKYPVIHYVYGGPHAQLIQDRWMGGQGRWILWMHYMAARGYVVFRLDNRGTPRRGIEFEQAIHRRLGTCEVEDQTRALDYVHGLGFTDPGRVGVHGWSFCGFMTLSLMTRAAERYRAGVAGAPVSDWAYYETGYGERYMDTPEENPGGYKAACPGRHVKGIKGRLLVVHGTADDTVMWQNTIDFLGRCIEAGVEVETMIYPGDKHGLRGKSFVHFVRKMTRFFDQELKPGAGS
jgi:dipeptidyl-peptidase 4